MGQEFGSTSATIDTTATNVYPGEECMANDVGRFRLGYETVGVAHEAGMAFLLWDDSDAATDEARVETMCHCCYHSQWACIPCCPLEGQRHL